MDDAAVAAATTTTKVSAAMTQTAERGDLETTLRLFRKLESLQGAPKTAAAVTSLPTRQSSWPMIQLMARRAEANKFDDVLAVADTFLETARKQNVAAPKSYSSSRRRSSQQPLYVTTVNGFTNGRANYGNAQLAFPTPNDYYDESMISVLYNAHALFKKADLLTDLHAHVSKATRRGDRAGQGSTSNSPRRTCSGGRTRRTRRSTC